MNPHVSLITLGTTDIERSRAFYRDGLKLPVKVDFGRAVFFQMNGLVLGIYPRDLLAKDTTTADGGPGFTGITLAHNTRSKEDVHKVLDEARAAGAKIVKEAQATDWGGYSGYFVDPDGHYWEVAFNPEDMPE